MHLLFHPIDKEMAQMTPNRRRGFSASEKQNEEVLEQLNATERAEIKDIQAALIRVREGNYTLCMKCGAAITSKRLEALPYTNSCITCAS